jgi:hypothetical protein
LLIPSISFDPVKTPWWQEGQQIGVVQFTTGVSVPITPAKISTIVVLSSEILSCSLPTAELMVRSVNRPGALLGSAVGRGLGTRQRHRMDRPGTWDIPLTST